MTLHDCHGQRSASCARPLRFAGGPGNWVLCPDVPRGRHDDASSRRRPTRACRREHQCAIPVAWAQIQPSGTWALVDLEELPPERVKPRLLVVNSDTKGAKVITEALIDEGMSSIWLAKFPMGVHRLHAANPRCAAVIEARRLKKLAEETAQQEMPV
jgi:hypothetical protein